MAGLLAQTYQDERAERVRASLSFCGSVNCRHPLPGFATEIADDVDTGRHAAANRYSRNIEAVSQRRSAICCARWAMLNSLM